MHETRRLSAKLFNAALGVTIADLPKGEDVELRIFVDKYLVEVFANDRQAMVASHADYSGKPDLNAFTALKKSLKQSLT